MVTRQQPTVKPSILAGINSNLALAMLIIGGLVNTGVMYAQFAQVKETLASSMAEQKLINSKITEFREKQIGGLQDIATLKTSVQAIDSRVLVIERIFIEQPKRVNK